MHSKVFASFTVLAMVALVACGGGGGDGGSSTGGVVPGGGGSGTVSASFVADVSSPGPSTVSLQQGSASANVVSVAVRVTDVADIYGVSLDLVFDPTRVEFVGAQPGSLLESDGASVQYEADVVGTNRLVVGATRLGAAAGVDAVGSRNIVVLTFRLTREGTSAAVLENHDLLDDQASPAPIPGIQWGEGSFVGS